MPDHATVQSTARSGKSYGIIKRATEEMDDERIVYLAPTHEEAKATVKKWRKHGIEPGYLVGQQRARQDYDITCTGSLDPSFNPANPTEARKRDDVNAYQSLMTTVQNKQVVVTVPELLNKVGEYDWLIMTEEAAFKRMLSSPIQILDIKRVYGYDRRQMGSITRYESKMDNLIDEIDSLQQTDEIHDIIYEAAKAVQDICYIVKEWLPKDWHGVDKDFEELRAKVDDRLNGVARANIPDFERVFTRLQNYNRIETLILNVIYYDGLLVYGHGESEDDRNDNRKQMFAVGDTERVFRPIDDDVTLWLGGNSIPAMTEFHELVHGDPPEPVGFLNGYEPIRDALDDNIVIKYTGRDNQNQQSRDVQDTIEQVQALNTDASSLIISGSSKYCADHATKIQKCITPSADDTLSDVKDYARNGMSVAIPENSQFSEGVDTPEFNMGAIYNGKFAAPRESYIEEKTGDNSLLRAERIRATQNAILRPSNIPNGHGGVTGTGKTPIIVPSYHVDSAIFDLFEEYDITVYETDDMSEVRRLIIKLLGLDAEEHDGDIKSRDSLPPRIKEFNEIFDEPAASASAVTH